MSNCESWQRCQGLTPTLEQFTCSLQIDILAAHSRSSKNHALLTLWVLLRQISVMAILATFLLPVVGWLVGWGLTALLTQN